jgi:hypothetical protein
LDGSKAIRIQNEMGAIKVVTHIGYDFHKLSDQPLHATEFEKITVVHKMCVKTDSAILRTAWNQIQLEIIGSLIPRSPIVRTPFKAKKWRRTTTEVAADSLNTILQHYHHLENRCPAGVAPDVERLQYMVERHIGVLECPEHGLPNTL